MEPCWDSNTRVMISQPSCTDPSVLYAGSTLSNLCGLRFEQNFEFAHLCSYHALHADMSEDAELLLLTTMASGWNELRRNNSCLGCRTMACKMRAVSLSVWAGDMSKLKRAGANTMANNNDDYPITVFWPIRAPSQSHRGTLQFECTHTCLRRNSGVASPKIGFQRWVFYT